MTPDIKLPDLPDGIQAMASDTYVLYHLLKSARDGYLSAKRRIAEAAYRDNLLGLLEEARGHASVLVTADVYSGGRYGATFDDLALSYKFGPEPGTTVGLGPTDVTPPKETR